MVHSVGFGCSALYLSEVEFEDVANVVWRTLGQLYQLFAILEGLAQFLNSGLHPVHPVDALRGGSAALFPRRSRSGCEHSAQSHLHLQRPSLDLRNALGDDEGDAVAGTAGHLGEVPAEELQTALQLLMAALDGQSLQTALVTGQETLTAEESVVCPSCTSPVKRTEKSLTSSHSAPWKYT